MAGRGVAGRVRLPSDRPDRTPAGVSITVANETGAPLTAVVELAGGALATYGLAAGATGVVLERTTPGSVDAVVRFVTADRSRLARQAIRLDAAVTLEVLSLGARSPSASSGRCGRPRATSSAWLRRCPAAPEPFPSTFRPPYHHR